MNGLAISLINLATLVVIMFVIYMHRIDIDYNKSRIEALEEVSNERTKCRH